MNRLTIIADSDAERAAARIRLQTLATAFNVDLERVDLALGNNANLAFSVDLASVDNSRFIRVLCEWAGHWCLSLEMRADSERWTMDLNSYTDLESFFKALQAKEVAQ